MREFAQIIKDVAEIYGHSTEVMAEALDMPELTMREIIESSNVPGSDFVDKVTSVYHLENNEAHELRRAWSKARTELSEKINRLERQFNATRARKTLGTNMNHVNTRWMYVLAASQYIHNTYTDTESLPANLQTIVKMRNELVYNYGSDEFAAFTVKLQDDEWWNTVYEEMEKVLNS